MFRKTTYLLIAMMLITAQSWGKLYKFEYQKSIYLKKAGELNISNRAGNINIVGGTENKIDIHAVKFVRASDPNEAESLTEYIRINTRQDGNKVSIKTEHKKLPNQSPSFWNKIFGDKDELFGSVDFVIAVPKDCVIDIKNSSGNITISNLEENINLLANSGEIRLDSISGDADIELNTGKALITTMNGNLNISAPASNIELYDITGAVDIRSSSGDKKMTDILGRLDIAQTSGEITINNLQGDLRLTSTTGNIKIDQNNGTLNILGHSGDITIATKLESINDYYIETTSGDIHLSVPESSSGSVKLKTVSGKISTDIPMSVESISNTMVAGSFGEGEPLITLVSSSGNISMAQF